jgi:FKBP-type peptidyl-prolyl cis-trans isomerase SlpA
MSFKAMVQGWNGRIRRLVKLHQSIQLATALNPVQPGSFLTLHYRLAGPDGADIINTFADKPATLSLGSGELAPAMESRLIGLAEGTRAAFELAPGEAFGARNPDLVQRVRRSLLDELGAPDAGYDVGDVVQFPTPDRQGAYAGVVREVGGDWLLFDFNHPLAGQAVTFEVQLIGVL